MTSSEVDPHGYTVAAALNGAQVKTLELKNGRVVAERPFAKGYRFTFETGRWERPSEVECTLKRLQERPECGVLRGEVLPQLKSGKATGRRCYNDPDPEANSLRPASRGWIALDVDGASVPLGLGDPGRLDEGAAYLRDEILPSEFRGREAVVTATARSGLVGADLWRGRLWFFLDRAVADAEARSWAKGFAAASGVALDPCLYTPNQPHFVGRPKIIGGVDPIPDRLRVFTLPGRAEDFRVALDVEKFAGLALELEARERAAVRNCGSDWKLLAETIIGQEISNAQTGLMVRQYREPSERVIATAVRAGAELADVQRVIAESLAACGVPGRYGDRWVAQAFNSFVKRDQDAARRSAQSLAELEKFF